MRPSANDLNLKNRPLAGALFVLGSSLMFALMGACVKIVSASLPDEVIVFFRNFYVLLLLLPFLSCYPPRGGIKTGHFRLHLIRSVAGLGGMYCFFYALGHLPFAEAVLFSFTSPLFIPIVAYLWIGEPVPCQVRGAVLVGFVGVLLVIKPGTEMFRPVALVGIISGFSVAVAMVSIRRMSESEPPARIVFYFSLLATPVSVLPLFSSWQSPQGETWGILFLMGLFAVAGQLMMTKGYSLAAAARVAPFSYAIVIFSAVIGQIFWNENLDQLSAAGALLICFAGILTAFRSKPQTVVPAMPGTWHGSEKPEK